MPAFDFAWDFRNTGAYVTDPAYAVPALYGDGNYPHTYTNGNGLSINAGPGNRDSFGNLDRSTSNDPRIAGTWYIGNIGSTDTFKVDLSSGSAPGAGDYSIDAAFGDASASRVNYFKIADNTTTLIDGTAGASTAAGHYIDASLANVTASTSWTGTPVTKTFATTTVIVTLGIGGQGELTCFAHFRLTLASSQSAVPVLMAQYRQRRS